MTEVLDKKTCPQCNTVFSYVEGYIAWCENCNWNVEPLCRNEEKGPLEKIYNYFGKKWNQKLFSELEQEKAPRAKLTLVRFLVYFISTCVLLTSIICWAIGIFLLSLGWHNILVILLALLCFAIGIFTLPRIPTKSKNVLSEKDYPALYSLINQIALKLGAKHKHNIIVNEDFNASYSSNGVLGKRTITIGLPLFSVLNNQEKVAIIAHEISHGINGDLIRSFFVSSTLNSLIRWFELIRPSQIWQVVDIGPFTFLTPFVMVFVNLALWGLSELLILISYIFVGLFYKDSQRAEYLADHLAATVSGTASMISSLEKLYYYENFDTVVQRIALKKDNSNVFDSFREHIAKIPEKEHERLRRASIVLQNRVDTTHPPTAFRVDLLKAHFLNVSDLSSIDFNKVEEELKKFEKEIQKKTINQYIGSLYY